MRHRILARPVWLEVRAVPETQAIAFPLILHRGERESILLMEALRADFLLIDEHAGRTIAFSRKLSLSGTLGVLEQADEQGLVDDFSHPLQQLKANRFYISDTLEKQLLQRHIERRRVK